MSSHANAHAGTTHRPPVTFDRLPPPAPPVLIRPSRPIGVALLAILLGLLGFVVLLAGLLVLVSAYTGELLPPGLLIVRSIDPVGAAILAIFGAILLAVASALWNQERWALWTTIGVLFFGLTYLFFTGSITLLFLLVLGLFVYLLSVRHHFY